jgi:hypothetical protein
MADFGRVPLTPMEALRQRAEPLWIAALGVQFVVLGPFLVPTLIRVLGGGGHIETVEWAIYMSLLVGYLPVVWFFGRVAPQRLSPETISAIRLVILLATLLEFGLYAITANGMFLLSAVFAACVTILPLGYAVSRRSRAPGGPAWTLARVAPLGVAGAFAWMCAGSLVSWGDAMFWLASSPRTAITLVVATALSVFALAAARDKSSESKPWPRWWDYLAIAVLAAFSFRTSPMVEFYHWGLYVGPIEQLRQGGWLLWDTPSQYGFLSSLIPSVLPGNAWVSFWFFQSVIFAVVAALIYAAFRQLGSRWTGAPFALVVTFTTLFFRPRDESVILPAQMTPSGGPVRFLWCFVLLTFIAAYYFRPPERKRARDFALGGTAIWLLAVLWSAEGAIYCSAIWFFSYGVFVAQQVMQWRENEVNGSDILRRAVGSLALPVAALAALALLITLIYTATIGTAPDWRGYWEYVLLYSGGGFGALAVDPSGAVWYLMLLFLTISTIAGMYVTSDLRDPRLVVLAGVWGGAWSVGSYFVGRSHPVNALSLTPLLLFSVAIAVRLCYSDRPRRWHRLFVSALIPAFAMPITLTLGHAAFPDAMAEPQLPVSRFTDQLPTMEPALSSLLRQASAQPTDPFVRIADGRLLLPAWPSAGSSPRIVSQRSWLPKPYEIIASLSPERRQTYIDRNAKRMPLDGWLIHSKHDTIPDYPALLAEIERTRREQRRFENADWIVSWMAIGRRAMPKH